MSDSKGKKDDEGQLTAEQRKRLARMAQEFPGLIKPYEASDGDVAPPKLGVLSDFLKLAVMRAKRWRRDP